jgi:hypothetical protein
MKTAITQKGVTARCVSRRIKRSSDNRAAISRGTGLSVVLDSIPLLSQIVGSKIILNFAFRAQEAAELRIKKREDGHSPEQIQFEGLPDRSTWGTRAGHIAGWPSAGPASRITSGFPLRS